MFFDALQHIKESLKSVRDTWDTFLVSAQWKVLPNFLCPVRIGSIDEKFFPDIPRTRTIPWRDRSIIEEVIPGRNWLWKNSEVWTAPPIRVCDTCLIECPRPPERMQIKFQRSEGTEQFRDVLSLRPFPSFLFFSSSSFSLLHSSQNLELSRKKGLSRADSLW